MSRAWVSAAWQCRRGGAPVRPARRRPCHEYASRRRLANVIIGGESMVTRRHAHSQPMTSYAASCSCASRSIARRKPDGTTRVLSLPETFNARVPFLVGRPAALTSLDINTTLVIGGTTVINSTAGLPNPTRLGGANQYEVSQAVVTQSKARGLPGNIGDVADGRNRWRARRWPGAGARATAPCSWPRLRCTAPRRSRPTRSATSPEPAHRSAVVWARPSRRRPHRRRRRWRRWRWCGGGTTTPVAADRGTTPAAATRAGRPDAGHDAPAAGGRDVPQLFRVAAPKARASQRAPAGTTIGSGCPRRRGCRSPSRSPRAGGAAGAAACDRREHCAGRAGAPGSRPAGR